MGYFWNESQPFISYILSLFFINLTYQSRFDVLITSEAFHYIQSKVIFFIPSKPNIYSNIKIHNKESAKAYFKKSAK